MYILINNLSSFHDNETTGDSTAIDSSLYKERIKYLDWLRVACQEESSLNQHKWTLKAYGFAIRDPGELARVIYRRNIFIDVWVLPFQKVRP